MKPLKILFIEDDLIEKMKLERVLTSLQITADLVMKENGEEALEYLESGDYPSLILLDLNMPEMNGIEFLNHMYLSPEIRHIPTVVLTTSSNEQDLKECYALGIAGYVLKPLKYEDYVETIRKLMDYWSINEII